MDMSAGQSTLRQPLPMGWIRKLFAELQGNYGTRFLDMWRSGQTNIDGDDVGLQNAMSLWAERLAGFADRPDAIRRVLDTLPKHPPTLPEFVELCRSSCPLPIHKSLPAPGPSEQQRAERVEQLATEVFVAREPGKHWARRLRAEWLDGRSLMPIQIELASSALGERWHSDNGQRECSEILDEATA